MERHQDGCEDNCVICLDGIALEEIALVKGCEHAYCVTCILHWATYKSEPTCPQCKHPFEFLHVHRTLDGRIEDYMHEESVCLLRRASWFKPMIAEEGQRIDDNMDDLYAYEDPNDILEVYLTSSSGLRIGNRRWGANGYVREARQEARPAHRTNSQDIGAGASRQTKNQEAVAPNETVGRRAKRALKREAADKAAAEKHQQHLARLGRT